MYPNGAFTFININKDPSAGSGVLISRNLVLTAAHNLYDKENKQENAFEWENKLSKIHICWYHYLNFVPPSHPPL
jgi:V8-like Glu-specific endopeptidase